MFDTTRDLTSPHQELAASQCRAINAFCKTDAMTITAWRTAAFDASVTAPHRLMGIDFRSHPINGWAEE
jgi:hypothetical protein